MRLIYLTVTIFWIFLLATNCGFAQCTTFINPITGESVRYFHVQTNGPSEYISLSKSGQKIIFSFVNNLIVEPTFKIKDQTEIIFKTKNGLLVLVTEGDSKGSAVGYSIWTTINQDDLKKMVGTETIEFDTSKGPYKIELKKKEISLFNTALTCVN